MLSMKKNSHFQNSFILFRRDRKSTRLNSSHTVIYTLSLHDALPISLEKKLNLVDPVKLAKTYVINEEKFPLSKLIYTVQERSEEHTSELQSHSDLHSFPTRRSSDLIRKKIKSGRPSKTCKNLCYQ